MSSKQIARETLAKILLAKDLYYQIINKEGFSDLTGLNRLFKDGGFFHMAVRPILALSKPSTIDEKIFKTLSDKTFDFKTVFLNKNVLEENAKRDLKQELTDAKKDEDYIQINLFDALVFNEINNTHITFDNPNDIDFSSSLDDPSRIIAQEMSPAYCYSFVTPETMQTIASILDLDDESGVKEGLKILKEDPFTATYTTFLSLVELHGI